MKNRINRLLKIGILCLAMALIQTGCEKNDNSIDNELQQEKKVSRVSFSDFNINVAHNRQYQDLEKHFDFKKSSNQNLQNRIDANDDITVLTDEILVIQKNDISYYTFKIVAPSENNEFYNLVVHVNNQQQIIKSELYEYIPNNEWLEDINQPYTGQIKVLDNDIISLDDLFSARGSGRCLTGASGEWECSFGNEHAPGTCNGSSFEYIITLEYGPCPNEPVDYIIAEAPDQGGSGGGGGGSTPNQNPTPTIPTTPCEQNDGTSTQTIGITDGSGDCLDMDALNNIQTIENCINNSTIDFYSLSSTDLSAISNFINTNGCNEENKAFSKFAIEAIQEDFHDSTIEELFEVLDFEQDYRTKMSASELTIFDNLDRNKQLKYLQSAYNATVMSEDLYPNTLAIPCNLYNGIGDAYRHSLWNALSTVRLGETLTEQLTTAHEDRPAPIGYINYSKENQMDFHNNAQGRLIAYGSGLVWEMVKTSLENGDLRYLSNLDSSNTLSRCRATSSSILTPTN